MNSSENYTQPETQKFVSKRIQNYSMYEYTTCWSCWTTCRKKYFQNAVRFKCLRTTLINNNCRHYLLTYSMVQIPSWEANWFAASQEFPRISRNPKVNYRTHKRPPTVSILSQPNPVHIPTPHLLEIHPNIIHPSTPRSPQWYFYTYTYICILIILCFTINHEQFCTIIYSWVQNYSERICLSFG